MVDFKKMDEKDFVFVNKPLSPKQDKEFSEFLRDRKKPIKQKRNLSKALKQKGEPA